MKKITALLSLFLLLSCANYGEKKVFDGTEIYYKDGVTEAEVDKLGESLKESGFTDGSVKSVQYLKDGDTYVFKMIIKEEFLNNEAYEPMFRFMPSELSQYMGVPVDFHLTDEAFKTLRVYAYEDANKTLMAKATEIRYSKNVTKQEAEKLGDFLIDYGFATDDKAKTVALDKEDNNYIFKVVTGTDTEQMKTMEAFLSLLKISLSKEVFNNQIVKVHMCDAYFNTIKVI